MIFAGCPVDESIFAAWQRHWAPPSQPFFVSDALLKRLPPWPRFTRREFGESGVALSLHDTFTTYRVNDDPPWVVWLTYEAFSSLGHDERFDLLGEQRTFGRAGAFHLDEVADQVEVGRIATLATDGFFVWWPKLWGLLYLSERERVLRALVETDRLPCRRDDLSARDWHRIGTRLPGARELAGSFLPESGGNCLATVMAAYGAPAVAERWVYPEPFGRWLDPFTLSRSARTVLEPPDLGDVLVWRDQNARIQHAAVSLGEGLILHKEAQCWYVPRQVVRFKDALDRWQDDGHLSLYNPVEGAGLAPGCRSL